MSISKHSTYNLVGALLPIAVTLLTVPLYLQVVGAERYGALSIAWVLLGYLGFLDLGLGAAVSQRIAASTDNDAPRQIFWTALWTSLGMSLFAALLFYAGCAIYFAKVAPTSVAMREFAEAAPWIGLILPVAMLSGVTGGALHGRQRFLALNAINATSSTLMSVLPLLVALLWSATLSGLIAGAIAARSIGFILHLWACRRALPLRGFERPRPELLRSLLSFGGWVTVTTAVSPLLLTVDRLAIGAAIGAAAVASYSIAFSLVARMAIIPASLASALFPRFASDDLEERARLVSLSLVAIAAVMTPLAITALILIKPFFNLWLGEEMARSTVPVAMALVAGAWTNSLTFVPFTLLQGSGRPDVVARTHLMEVVPYWIVLSGGLFFFGLVGAAAAWTLRVSADCLLLCWRSDVRASHLAPLVMPLLLILLSFGALQLDGSLETASLLVLALAAALWSVFHMPGVIWHKLAQRGIRLPRAAAMD